MGNSRLKEIRYENDPTTRGKPLEIHHVTPKYEDEHSHDTFPITRPEHAQTHRLMALRGDNPQGNWWAVKQIVRRMFPQELQEYNKMVKKR